MNLKGRSNACQEEKRKHVSASCNWKNELEWEKALYVKRKKRKKMNSHHYIINCNDSKIFLNNTEYSEIIRVAKA